MKPIIKTFPGFGLCIEYSPRFQNFIPGLLSIRIACVELSWII
jgi:hypothetical protein